MVDLFDAEAGLLIVQGDHDRTACRFTGEPAKDSHACLGRCPEGSVEVEGSRCVHPEFPHHILGRGDLDHSQVPGVRDEGVPVR